MKPKLTAEQIAAILAGQPPSMYRHRCITPEVEAVIRDELAHQERQAGIGTLYAEQFGGEREAARHEGILQGLKILAANLLADKALLSDHD